ncbi:rhodanese domain-containing protein CG4456-like [Tribolium madens]|uniref:rhodanese domain-containing protein CG4456-like n=1 Tax=Tribolium madens TaxID=41895 RepID=UPI001CF74BA6|nr:rhodanese domain-containing protein CG4456-like [Tribolium madens]
MSLLRGRQILSFLQKSTQIGMINSTNLRILSTKIASFDEVKSVKMNPKTLLIDVREPHELQETGVIPDSINIPLGEVAKVLTNMSSEQFQKTYNRSKPDSSTPIIFSCRSGKRSALAQEVATKLGFKNIKNYSGGWLEWEEKNKKG